MSHIACKPIYQGKRRRSLKTRLIPATLSIFLFFILFMTPLIASAETTDCSSGGLGSRPTCMEYYTYGGFDAIANAFQRIALIFSDSGYNGLFFSVAVLGILFTAMGVFFKVATGGKGNALAWAWPVGIGIVLFLVFIVPKGIIVVNDPVKNKFVAIHNLPAGLVALAGTVNLVERGFVDIITQGDIDGRGYKSQAGGMGFNMLLGMSDTGVPLSDPMLNYSVQKFCEDCLLFAVSQGDVTVSDILKNTDTIDAWQGAANPAIWTVWYDQATPRGQTMSCLEAYNKITTKLRTAAASDLSSGNPYAPALKQRCAEMGFDPENSVEFNDCVARSTTFARQFLGNNVRNLSHLHQQMAFAQNLRQVLASASIDQQISVQGSARAGQQGMASGIMANEWIPVIRAVVTAIAIGMVPFLLIFLPTGLFPKVISIIAGFFIWLTAWGITDAIIHGFAMDMADRAFEAVKQNELGFTAMMNFSSSSMKTLSMFAMIRWSGVMLATVVTGILVKFGGHALAQLSGNITSPISSAGGKAASAVDTQGYSKALSGATDVATGDSFIKPSAVMSNAMKFGWGERAESQRVEKLGQTGGGIEVVRQFGADGAEAIHRAGAFGKASKDAPKGEAMLNGPLSAPDVYEQRVRGEQSKIAEEGIKQSAYGNDYRQLALGNTADFRAKKDIYDEAVSAGHYSGSFAEWQKDVASIGEAGKAATAKKYREMSGDYGTPYQIEQRLKDPEISRKVADATAMKDWEQEWVQQNPGKTGRDFYALQAGLGLADKKATTSVFKTPEALQNFMEANKDLSRGQLDAVTRAMGAAGIDSYRDAGLLRAIPEEMKKSGVMREYQKGNLTDDDLIRMGRTGILTEAGRAQAAETLSAFTGSDLKGYQRTLSTREGIDQWTKFDQLARVAQTRGMGFEELMRSKNSQGNFVLDDAQAQKMGLPGAGSHGLSWDKNAKNWVFQDQKSGRSFQVGEFGKEGRDVQHVDNETWDSKQGFANAESALNSFIKNDPAVAKQIASAYGRGDVASAQRMEQNVAKNLSDALGSVLKRQGSLTTSSKGSYTSSLDTSIGASAGLSAGGIGGSANMKIGTSAQHGKSVDSSDQRQQNLIFRDIRETLGKIRQKATYGAGRFDQEAYQQLFRQEIGGYVSKHMRDAMGKDAQAYGLTAFDNFIKRGLSPQKPDSNAWFNRSIDSGASGNWGKDSGVSGGWEEPIPLPPSSGRTKVSNRPAAPAPAPAESSIKGAGRQILGWLSPSEAHAADLPPGGGVTMPTNSSAARSQRSTGRAEAKAQNIAQQVMSGRVGALSQFFETRKANAAEAVKTVSSGKGDPGGVSYGAYQLSTDKGAMQEFLNSKEGRRWNAELTAAGPIGSDGFNKKYSEIAGRDFKAFEQAQTNFAARSYYRPAVAQASQKGFDTENRGV